MKLRVEYLNEEVKRLKRGTLMSSGLDISAYLPTRGEQVIEPHHTVIVPTGIKMHIPDGYEILVRPRSGMSKRGIQCNLGTIDSDYRGEIGISLTNTTEYPFVIENGERVAQLVMQMVFYPELEEVDSVDVDTERGANGFGSTGRL